jgi:hypothetical protein
MASPGRRWFALDKEMPSSLVTKPSKAGGKGEPAASVRRHRIGPCFLQIVPEAQGGVDVLQLVRQFPGAFHVGGQGGGRVSIAHSSRWSWAICSCSANLLGRSAEDVCGGLAGFDVIFKIQAEERGYGAAPAGREDGRAATRVERAAGDPEEAAV